MEISRVTPIRRTWSNGEPIQSIDGFEVLFDDGDAVYMNEATLLNYRRFQQAILGALGVLWSHEYAEMRGGPAAWRMHIGRLLKEPAVVPTWETDGYGRLQQVSLLKWRREQREQAEGAA
jgi:hypothetical protein